MWQQPQDGAVWWYSALAKWKREFQVEIKWSNSKKSINVKVGTTAVDVGVGFRTEARVCMELENWCWSHSNDRIAHSSNKNWEYVCMTTAARLRWSRWTESLWCYIQPWNSSAKLQGRRIYEPQKNGRGIEKNRFDNESQSWHNAGCEAKLRMNPAFD